MGIIRVLQKTYINNVEKSMFLFNKNVKLDYCERKKDEENYIL